MPNKFVDYKRNYLLHYYADNPHGIIGKIYAAYWTKRIKRMSEGEVLDIYYILTERKEEDEFYE